MRISYEQMRKQLIEDQKLLNVHVYSLEESLDKGIIQWLGDKLADKRTPAPTVSSTKFPNGLDSGVDPATGNKINPASVHNPAPIKSTELSSAGKYSQSISGKAQRTTGLEYPVHDTSSGLMNPNLDPNAAVTLPPAALAAGATAPTHEQVHQEKRVGQDIASKVRKDMMAGLNSEGNTLHPLGNILQDYHHHQSMVLDPTYWAYGQLIKETDKEIEDHTRRGTDPQHWSPLARLRATNGEDWNEKVGIGNSRAKKIASSGDPSDPPKMHHDIEDVVLGSGVEHMINAMKDLKNRAPTATASGDPSLEDDYNEIAKRIDHYKDYRKSQLGFGVSSGRTDYNYDYMPEVAKKGFYANNGSRDVVNLPPKSQQAVEDYTRHSAKRQAEDLYRQRAADAHHHKWIGHMDAAGAPGAAGYNPNHSGDHGYDHDQPHLSMETYLGDNHRDIIGEDPMIANAKSHHRNVIELQAMNAYRDQRDAGGGLKSIEGWMPTSEGDQHSFHPVRTNHESLWNTTVRAEDQKRINDVYDKRMYSELPIHDPTDVNLQFSNRDWDDLPSSLKTEMIRKHWIAAGVVGRKRQRDAITSNGQRWSDYMSPAMDRQTGERKHLTINQIQEAQLKGTLPRTDQDQETAENDYVRKMAKKHADNHMKHLDLHVDEFDKLKANYKRQTKPLREKLKTYTPGTAEYDDTADALIQEQEEMQAHRDRAYPTHNFSAKDYSDDPYFRDALDWARANHGSHAKAMAAFIHANGIAEGMRTSGLPPP